MNFWKRRKLKKAVHQILHEAAHARHLREDIAAAADLETLIAAEQGLRHAWKAGATEAELEVEADKVHAAVDKVSPPRPGARWRENVEILVVALAVAMAFRTHFLMPFKIPTNSMWPTLYGITVDPAKNRDVMDTFPLSVVRWCLTGESYVEVRSQAAGVPHVLPISGDDFIMVDVGGIRHKLPIDFKSWTFDPRSPPFVQSGQILAQGRRRLGDFLFVNRMAYNFRRPVRGDVIVFSTQDVRYSGVRTNEHYIKRLVALPGEKVSLRPPYLEIDGVRITEPEPFKRLLTASGLYSGIGYSPVTAMDAWLAPQHQPRTLSPTQYLPFGDNTDHSLDGRYFGPIEQKRLVGPALCVYWPFGTRWGLIH